MNRKTAINFVQQFNLLNVHSSWDLCLEKALSTLDPHYLHQLSESTDWLPGPESIFNAFSIPLSNVRYVLFGESPYPRKNSAIGYAFWDGAVNLLWSEKGLNKNVNRATSLRNLIKMLLVSEGLLSPNTLSQNDIANIDKSSLIQTNAELFANFHEHGFLLLNACLVLQSGPKARDAKAWLPFIQTILNYLLKSNSDVTFIFFGKIAAIIDNLLPDVKVQKLIAEHPYNYSFITNQKVLDFFRPFHLLLKAKNPINLQIDK